MEETPAASNAPTVRQGCSLIAGGALLGFFGCLGAISVSNQLLALMLVIPGAIVMFWGAFKVATVIWRAMSKPLDQ